MTRIPRGSQPLAAHAMQNALDKVVFDPSKLAFWRHLLCLAYICLHVPFCSKVSSSKEKSLTSKVNCNLRRFLDALNEDDLAIIEAIHLSIPRSSRKPKDPKKFFANKISDKISEENIKGAVRLASSDCTFIPPNTEMLEILRCKHPPKTSSISASPSSSTTLDLQYHTVESEVLKAIRSFPNGSGGGLYGLRPQHLTDLVGGGNREHESSLLKSLTLYVNLVLAGGVPAEIRPIFFGASLCALRKKDGGIRPIAIGNTLRRLISKVAVRGCSERCSNLLKPNQLGFGVRMGAEAAIHATRSFIESHRQNTILLKIDFTNAFNSIHRDKALEAGSEHLPSLFNYVLSSYGAPSFYHTETICFSQKVSSKEILWVLSFFV